MDSLINQHGASVDIYRESKGGADSYGDRAVTWTKTATETAWIQTRRRARDVTVAGRFPESEYIGFFRSDSVIQENDYVQKDSAKYEVQHVGDAKLYGAVSHREVYLKVMVEG